MVRIRAAIQAGTFPATMSELRLRAGRVSGGEGTESRREGSPGRLEHDAEAHRWARETGPQGGQEEAEGQERATELSPLSEPPQNVEVIRKPRKERHVVEDDTNEG